MMAAPMRPAALHPAPSCTPLAHRHSRNELGPSRRAPARRPTVSAIRLLSAVRLIYLYVKAYLAAGLRGVHRCTNYPW
jgi:hypothetical protein